MIEKILAAMQGLIAKHGLELMQRYPNDLLVIDREVLERNALPGVKIAWMVGHSHTHITVLGIHARENECVTYHTNLCNDDRFYLLSIGMDSFSIKEQTREAYKALAHTRVSYEKQGDKSSFWLSRNKTRIGHVCLTSIGTFASPKESARITPIAGISKQDRAALEMWCAYAVREKANTLFVRSVVEWGEPARLQLVA
jgi:hypothetical protein